MKQLIADLIDQIINEKEESARATFHQYIIKKTIEENDITPYGMGDPETDPEAWQRAGLTSTPKKPRPKPYTQRDDDIFWSEFDRRERNQRMAYEQSFKEEFAEGEGKAKI